MRFEIKPGAVSNERGGVIVEYLMMVVLVAAVAVPIIIAKFGAPLLENIQGERQKLVEFIGQTDKRRRPVPKEWFSQGKVAKPQTQDLNQPSDLNEPAPVMVGDVPPPGQVRTGEVTAGKEISGGGAVSSGNITTGGAGGGYSGVGSQAGGGGGLSGGDEFFSSPPQSPNAKSLSGDEGESGKTGTGSGSGGSGFSGSGQGREDEFGLGKKDQVAGKSQTGDGGRLAGDKKRSLVEAQNELDERAKSKKFDWWLLIKILLVILIIALIFLIAIGNTRRSG